MTRGFILLTGEKSRVLRDHWDVQKDAQNWGATGRNDINHIKNFLSFLS